MTTRRPLLFAIILASIATLGANAPQRQRHHVHPVPLARFFFEGNGTLRLRHGHFDTTLDVRYRRADGSYDPAALAQIRHFFRSREDGREAPISLRLIELLAYIQDHYHPKQMILLSGYRSPQFNADIRASGGMAAKTSLHTQGLAADVEFTGLSMRQLWLTLRALHTGGVGYYRKGHFLHIDTGPPRFWEETTSRVGENLSAGNARVFLRTDYDRYTQVTGAVCSLHSVTALPLLIAADATLTGPQGTTPIRLQALDGAVSLEHGCFAITRAADHYEFRVAWVGHTVSQPAPSPTARAHLVLRTCTPRTAKTPAEIESNPIQTGL